MSLQMREATPADTEQILDVWFSAFGNEPITRATIPKDSGTGRTFWRQSLEAAFSDPNTTILVVTNGIGHEQQILAFAKWIHPGADVHDPPPAEAWPQDGNPDLAVRFFGMFARGHRRVMGDKRHWYLELLCTKREAKGRGAGSMLMQWGIERAVGDGLDVYLESTAEAEGMYTGKFGFEVKEREKFEVEGEEGVVLDVPFLVRAASN